MPSASATAWTCSTKIAPNQLSRGDEREKHIMVEVNLTSNDVILGQTHTDHPARSVPRGACAYGLVDG